MAIGARIASKTAGLVKGANKAMEGYPGIFHHLAGEHEEVAALMQSAAVADTKEREELYPVIHKSLLAHAHAEEECFYPQLLRFPKIHDLAAHCMAEHARIEELLRVLNSTDKATQNWKEIFDELRRVVQHHVEQEENELFPQAMELLDEGEAEEMNHQFKKVEKREKARLNR